MQTLLSALFLRLVPSVKDFIRFAFSRPIAVGAARVAIVVGVFLNGINQGGALLNGQAIARKSVVLNFVVPYCVAMYAAVRNERACAPTTKRCKRSGRRTSNVA